MERPERKFKECSGRVRQSVETFMQELKLPGLQFDDAYEGPTGAVTLDFEVPDSSLDGGPDSNTTVDLRGFKEKFYKEHIDAFIHLLERFPKGVMVQINLKEDDKASVRYATLYFNLLRNSS